jgi:hypothetical protein
MRRCETLTQARDSVLDAAGNGHPCSGSEGRPIDQNFPLIGVLLPRVIVDPRLCIEDPRLVCLLTRDAGFACFGFFGSRLLLF